MSLWQAHGSGRVDPRVASACDAVTSDVTNTFLLSKPFCRFRGLWPFTVFFLAPGFVMDPCN